MIHLTPETCSLSLPEPVSTSSEKLPAKSPTRANQKKRPVIADSSIETFVQQILAKNGKPDRKDVSTIQLKKHSLHQIYSLKMLSQIKGLNASTSDILENVLNFVCELHQAEIEVLVQIPFCASLAKRV